MNNQEAITALRERLDYEAGALFAAIDALEQVEELKRLCEKAATDPWLRWIGVTWFQTIIQFLAGDPAALKNLVGEK